VGTLGGARTTTMAAHSLHVVVLLAIAANAAGTKCVVDSMTFVPGPDGNYGCFEDYDSDSSPPGRFCADHSAVEKRVMAKKVYSDLGKKEKTLTWQMCAAMCNEKGYTGIVGIEDGDECWCSNIKQPESTWVTDASGSCNNAKCIDGEPSWKTGGPAPVAAAPVAAYSAPVAAAPAAAAPAAAPMSEAAAKAAWLAKLDAEPSWKGVVASTSVGVPAYR